MKLNYYSFTGTLPEPIIDGRVDKTAVFAVVDSGMVPSRVKPMILQLLFTAHRLDVQDSRSSIKNNSPISLFGALEKALNGNTYTSMLRSAKHLSVELESRPKSSRPRRDFEIKRQRLGAKCRDETKIERADTQVQGPSNTATQFKSSV